MRSWTRRREEWRVNGGSTRMHSLGWRRSCVVKRRGNEVHREAETKDGGREMWRRQWGEAWKMIECIKYREEQPPTSLRHLYGQKNKVARRAVDIARIDEYGGRPVPKA